MLATPVKRDHKGPDGAYFRDGESSNLPGQIRNLQLLGTPRASDGITHPLREPGDVEDPRGRLEDQIALLPTPTVADSSKSGGGCNGQTNVTLTDATVRRPDEYGKYQPAIERWEQIIRRPAPNPRTPDGRHLNPALPEWMMGLPEGHITSTEHPDADSMTVNQRRGAMLGRAGNGVVPAQAAAAFTTLTGRFA